uniref:Uncharacterized protein n=1 Tax=Aegilops tauschii TaxID=37682 RepID=N1QRU0_AEGTA
MPPWPRTRLRPDGPQFPRVGTRDRRTAPASLPPGVRSGGVRSGERPDQPGGASGWPRRPRLPGGLGSGRRQRHKAKASVRLRLLVGDRRMGRFHTVPAVLAGDSLYWILAGISSSNVGFDFHAEWQILEFDLERQKLAVIQTPAMAKVFRKDRFTVVRGDGGGLGMLILKDFTAQLWKRKMDSDGVASWELEKSIDLNKLLSLNLNKMGCVRMLRFAEDNNLLVLHTYFGLFTVQLQSLQFKKLSGKKKLSHCHPFESVYTVGNSITSMPLHFCINNAKLIFDNWLIRSCSDPFMCYLFLLLLDDLFGI